MKFPTLPQLSFYALLSLGSLCLLTSTSCSHQISQGQEVEASSITLKDGNESYALFKDKGSQRTEYQMSYHRYPKEFNGTTQITSLGKVSMAEMQQVFALVRKFEASSFTPILRVSKYGEMPDTFEQQLELLMNGSPYAYDGANPHLQQPYQELLTMMKGYKQRAMNQGKAHTSYTTPR